MPPKRSQNLKIIPVSNQKLILIRITEFELLSNYRLSPRPGVNFVFLPSKEEEDQEQQPSNQSADNQDRGLEFVSTELVLSPL